MGRIRKFLRLPPGERALLLQAAALLAAIRLALAALPFERLRSVLARLAAGAPARGGHDEPPGDAARAQAVRAVETVSRHFPAIGTCLTQALAVYVLLGRTGQKSSLRIGATRNAEGSFVAHAWLEQDGIILIGGNCHGSYTPMPVLDGLEPPTSRPEPKKTLPLQID